MKYILRKIAVLPIQCYRRFISPWTPRTCRYQPTCSEYARLAILQRGILKGSLLSLWRILRCNPFGRGGYDPVPEKFEKPPA